MNWTLRVTSYPTTWLPVALQDVKDYLRISHDSDNAQIVSMIWTATRIAEGMMRRAVVPQVLEYRFDEFPGRVDPVELPHPPLSTSSSHVSVAYLDSSGAWATLPSTAYEVDYRSEPGRILPSPGNTWPDVGRWSPYPSRRDLGVTVTYRCGYEASSAIPEPIRHWVVMRVGAMYEHREALADRAPQELARNYVDGLLDPYRVF